MTSTEHNAIGEASGATARRQTLMRICAAATMAELEQALADCAPLPEVRDIRPPEVGLVMMRGRIGGTGAPFNAGEASVTRAVVQLASGETGFSYLLGRQLEKARLAAIVDAVGQHTPGFERMQRALVEPVLERTGQERKERACQREATKVDFFTMVRGED